ncbi:MAG: hypothetical protein O8C66_09930 [Candidatus Methanoperedens sp.]|nr:hypothetical protein [Candidatus Methanoperedens sp.]MCZ7370814.1 hypothetical protein [Candidatus Methanoperedens sp.]
MDITPILYWTEWRNIEDSAESNPAVYRIRLLKDKKPVVIPRWLKEDSEGVLYIGKNGDMEKGRKRFLKGFEAGGALKNMGGHPASNMIYLLRKVNIKIESKDLEYSYYKTKEIEQFEGEAIVKYFKTHGELPPLNSNFPKRKEWDNFISRSHEYGY